MPILHDALAVAHDVFISYASKDKPVADAVCAALESHRVRCWIAPRDVLPGKPYPEAIEQAITEAKLMVVIYSTPAAASSAVRSEIHLAFTSERTILPFRIEDIPLARVLPGRGSFGDVATAGFDAATANRIDSQQAIARHPR